MTEKGSRRAAPRQAGGGLSLPRSAARGRAQLELDVPAQTGYLSVIRELVAAAARESSLPALEMAKIVMAVDEACVNVVEHAYPRRASRKQARLEVHLEIGPACLDVLIRDRSAIAFSPLDHPAPDLASYCEAGRRKGLGLLILRRFVDRVLHSYEPGRGNQLRLIKNLK